MVTQPLFRAARVLAGFALAAAVPGAAAAEQPAILVDLRAEPEPAGGALAEELRKNPELSLPGEPALLAALAGAPAPATLEAGEAALERAGAAYGELDCERASAAARRAAGHLAAARAAAREDGRGEIESALERAHVYELLCADASGDPAAAYRAAERLRNLGARGAPKGVPEDLWEGVPEVDATVDVSSIPLEIRTDPEGAEVWVDHAPAGFSPARVLVAEGERLVAAARGDRAAAAYATAAAPNATLELSLAPRDGRWEELRRGIAAWKAGREPNAMEIANLLQRLEARVLIVRREAGIEVWGHAARARAARRLAQLEPAAAGEVAGAVAERVAAWDPHRRAGPEPGVPLLREDPEEGEARDEDDGPSWWVYASILGAVGIGAGFVIANDLADDRQRIELTWP